ncbi:MAG: sulfite exporter TauE/SafE family protein [Lachnospiraceae bacterium]|nr:sulfite exporter TauE/SafE family protein [Lachnospiraceae bacterium]
MKFLKKHINLIVGAFSGIINGLLGAGGGMLAVPTLKTQTEPQKAHATTVAIIMPMCLVSSIWYLCTNKVTISDAMPYAPYGVIGAIIGAFLLARLNAKWLRIIFNLFMLWAGIRMIMK